MPRNTRLTPNEISEIHRLVAEGARDGDIADRIGRSRQAVSKVRRLGHAPNTTTRGEVLHVRVTREEYDAFRALVEREGLTPSDGMRRLIRLAVGALDLRREEIEALAASRRELVAVGRNLNQLTQLGQSGRLTWGARDGATLARVEARVAELAEALTRFVNVARRRTLADAAFPGDGE
tara:strand:+ start:1090 stop:1626 length:537 start_codon:yes stop_codon:yes gene_type:complete